MKILRGIARSAASFLCNYPKIYRSLKWGYLSLPAAWRGTNLVHDRLAWIHKQGNSSHFVVVGANDGVTNDHIFQFAKRYRWKGLIIEPVLDYFKQAQQAYRGLPVLAVNCAVHAKETEMSFYFLEDNETLPLPPFAKGVGSFDRSAVEAQRSDIKDFDQYFREIKVPCMTLEAIVKKEHFPNPDIIIVDTEGYDAEVVKLIPLDDWKPHTIIYEHKLLEDSSRVAIESLLESKGYRLAKDSYDTLATLD